MVTRRHMRASKVHVALTRAPRVQNKKDVPRRPWTDVARSDGGENAHICHVVPIVSATSILCCKRLSHASRIFMLIRMRRQDQSAARTSRRGTRRFMHTSPRCVSHAINTFLDKCLKTKHAPASTCLCWPIPLARPRASQSMLYSAHFTRR